MRKLLGFSFVLVLLLSAAVFASSSVFFCDRTGAWGVSWAGSLGEVRALAEESCREHGGTNCKELISCSEAGYGAVSEDGQGSVGAYCGAATQGEADRQSLDACREVSDSPSSCYVSYRWKG